MFDTRHLHLVAVAPLYESTLNPIRKTKPPQIGNKKRLCLHHKDSWSIRNKICHF